MNQLQMLLVVIAVFVLAVRLAKLAIGGPPLTIAEREIAARYYEELYQDRFLVPWELKVVSWLSRKRRERRGKDILSQYEERFA